MQLFQFCKHTRRIFFLRLTSRLQFSAAIAVFACAAGICGHAATAAKGKLLAPTPPMGWNDWAHYKCGISAGTILDNARALVRSGLASAGYDTVTIDDCWMENHRDAAGNLLPDPERFPQGMKSMAQSVHAMGLKFGIYEDAGYSTCAGFAGSGEAKGGGNAHFFQDARLFASWGVDYLKLDGCNVYIPSGGSQAEAYRKAYAEESAALQSVGRPIVFSESAPAYFQGRPSWYDVLTWVRNYGQLWREGSDIANFNAADPARSRFQSVLWNYAYNLPLGRFQKPGNWNDADFIIGGDPGMSLAESRSQFALWSMMSAPLILSSDVSLLSPQAIAILSNHAVIHIDQDPLGRMATLVRRDPAVDVLLKKLRNGDYAVAVLNHGGASAQVRLRPADLGFAANAGCKLDAQDLWSHAYLPAVSALQSTVASHDTAIWRIHLSSCGRPARYGVITMIVPGARHRLDGYTRCLASPGLVEDCAGTKAESWIVGSNGTLQSAGQCLTVVRGLLAMRRCVAGNIQHWRYTLVGNLVAKDGQCLTASSSSHSTGLELQACGHNVPDQIWSLPN